MGREKAPGRKTNLARISVWNLLARSQHLQLAFRRSNRSSLIDAANHLECAPSGGRQGPKQIRQELPLTFPSDDQTEVDESPFGGVISAGEDHRSVTVQVPLPVAPLLRTCIANRTRSAPAGLEARRFRTSDGTAHDPPLPRLPRCPPVRTD